MIALVTMLFIGMVITRCDREMSQNISEQGLASADKGASLRSSSQCHLIKDDTNQMAHLIKGDDGRC